MVYCLRGESRRKKVLYNYIQNCDKMTYKGDYEPCQLLCPETFTWHVLTDKLRKYITEAENKKCSSRAKRWTPSPYEHLKSSMRGFRACLWRPSPQKSDFLFLKSKKSNLGSSIFTVGFP